MFKEVGKMLGDLQIENNKLKQALIEIKEVIEICSVADSSELLLKRMKHILREISEVLDE